MVYGLSCPTIPQSALHPIQSTEPQDVEYECGQLENGRRPGVAQILFTAYLVEADSTDLAGRLVAFNARTGGQLEILYRACTCMTEE